MKRVRIVQTETPEGPMQHSVFVESVADGSTLAKYRDKETREDEDGKKKTVSGVECARQAAKTNGWTIVQRG